MVQIVSGDAASFPVLEPATVAATSTALSLFDIKPPNGASLLTLTNNTASATTSFTDGAKAMSFLATDTGFAGQRVRFRGKAVPAGASWTATIGFWTPPFGRNTNFNGCGLGILENSTGKSLMLTYQTAGNAPMLAIQNYSSLTTFVNNVATVDNIFGGRFPIFFRVTASNTNYVFAYSLDFGVTWTTVSTLTKASYFTADRIGLFLTTGTAIIAGSHRMEVFYYDDPDFPAA